MKTSIEPDHADGLLRTSRPLAPNRSSGSGYRLMAVNITEGGRPVTVKRYPPTRAGLVTAMEDGHRLSRCLSQRSDLKTVCDWHPEEAAFYVATDKLREDWIQINPPPEWPQLLMNALRWKDPRPFLNQTNAAPCGLWRCLFRWEHSRSPVTDDQNRSKTFDAICAIEYAVTRVSLEINLVPAARAMARVLPTWHFYDAFYEYLFHAYGGSHGEALDRNLIDRWKRPNELKQFLGVFRETVCNTCDQAQDDVTKAEAALPSTERPSVAQDVSLFAAELLTARLSAFRAPLGAW